MTRGELLNGMKRDLGVLVVELNADGDHRAGLVAQNAIVAVQDLLDNLEEDGAEEYDFPTATP